MSQTPLSTSPTQRGSSPQQRSGLAEWWRIVAMGVALAGMVYISFFYETATNEQLGRGRPVRRVEVEVPQLDSAILAEIDDSTRDARLTIEPGPLAHLLETSLQVVPAAATALGMPDEPIPIEVLRGRPADYRGSYLAYEGKLGHLNRVEDGNPVEGYPVYEGWLDLQDSDDQVVFRCSIAPDDLQDGQWCRIEGFLMKLIDSHYFPTTEQAPLLVGPELFRRFEPWPEVTELDPAAFDDVHDGVWEDGSLVDMEEADRTLLESQSDPALWHLASYARHRSGGPEDTLGHWRNVPPFATKAQLDEAKYRRLERGEPFRLLGRFVKAEYSPARPNPIGATHWTQAWVQIRELGSKAVPVWIPKQIGDFQYNEGLEVRGYYFRNYVFDFDYYDKQARRRISGSRFTPVFVAAELNRFEPFPEHPATTWVKYGFVALVGFVIALFIVTARRDRLSRERHEQERADRQRRKLAAAREAGKSDQPAATS